MEFRELSFHNDHEKNMEETGLLLKYQITRQNFFRD